ncbi:hypothetical protein [Halorussus litoreus]|uniref:hypothetical protein n=1 Tax=Halorussus litoreus TaxID=1710536 RepID=UPI0013005CF6|nr:hypothetical protein [Halorussus litoreus]
MTEHPVDSATEDPTDSATGVAELLAALSGSGPIQRVRNYYLTDRETTAYELADGATIRSGPAERENAPEPA